MSPKKKKNTDILFWLACGKLLLEITQVPGTYSERAHIWRDF